MRKKYKILSFLLIFSMVLSIINLGTIKTFASDTTKIYFDDIQVKTDATSIVIPVKVDGLSDINTLDGIYMEVSYDNTKLTYTGLESGSSAPAFQYSANPSGNTIKISGFSAGSVKSNGDILKLKFDIKDKTLSPNFKISKCEINDIATTIQNGTISVPVAQTSTKNSIYFDNLNVAADKSEFVLPIKIKGITSDKAIEGILLKLSYDGQTVSYTGYENGTEAQGFQFFDNNTSNNLSITGFGASSIKTDGELLKLKFKILNKNNPINISIVKAQANDINADIQNGVISVASGNTTNNTKVYFANTTVASTDDTLIVPVKIMGLTSDNSMQGILLKLEYDNINLDYQGVDVASRTTGFQYFDNKKNNAITITGFGTNGLKSDGEILNLKFKVLKRVNPTSVTIKQVQINDVDVTAQSGSITFADAPVATSGLKDFTINSGKVVIASSSLFDYSVSVDKISDLTVAATTVDSNDSINIDKGSFNANGIAKVTIKVMSAKNPSDIKTYNITVVAKTATESSDLKNISVNGKQISEFDRNTLNYNVTISNQIKSLNIQANSVDTTNTVRISGNSLDSTGNATVTISVVTPSGAVKNYIVNITSQSDGDVFKIIAMNPGEDAVNVTVDSNIIIQFSKELYSLTADENSIYILDKNGVGVPASVKLDLNGTKATVHPYSSLQYNTEYTVVVSQDLNSKDEEPFPNKVSWKFTTAEFAPTPVVVPNKPTVLKGTSLSSFSIKWTWTDNSTNETGFLIKDENGKTIQKIDKANSNLYTETGLNPNTEYKRTVSAYTVDDLGTIVESDPSLPASVKTKAFKLKPIVIFARVNEITSEKIIWRWYQKGDTSTEIKLYDKDMKLVDSVSASSQKYEDNIDIDKNDAEFVRYFTVYDPTLMVESAPFKATVVNPYYGTGKSLNAPIAKASSIANGTITLTIKDKSRDEQGFRIYRTNVAGQIQEMVQEAPTSDANGINENIGVKITGLDTLATYYYVVKAYNSTSEGDTSEVISVNGQ
ncbi:MULTISPECIES: cohesin domain-containing protein [Clostridium]|uniref:Cohesin domain-containing protein n=1 Tax=Clostridium frigoriphilum TaxID=443253 RepID=A0ABU7UL48_9CLOT|nr:cohesin domain-containing protein [Clostridium sp. DSM 17811]MBU3097667.1 Ig-like domain-containing protein [Clostridium sp. DSM 17811]